ncbi:ATP-binding cassette domain-containing protein [Sedimentibacter sp.]|uniref:ATP-binding cassette domain-containing protein n=1 Tax=Sedimentibacter sp. TaxID=1960295 RepID=UPI002898F78D|nr:ATP-binding cassette domain-containing protein [Sedimentibacter sp.]
MKEMTLSQLLEQYPFVLDFLQQNRLEIQGYENLTFMEYLAQMDEEELEEKAIDAQNLPGELNSYIMQMMEFLGLEKDKAVQSLTILPGQNKSGEAENFDKLEILPSHIVSIVGPTGSGKSRLLADIEWAAQGDTPTKRSILINNQPPDLKWRYSPNNKLVAQLSQNMNFVMDLSAGEFVKLHAESRMVENPDEIAERILESANYLAGESFLESTPVTSLSGGQSRALMIADTAILSKSPIVLIDEIENAGIDRKKALELLVSQDKIVLMATHDPLLALMADRRIVIRNGGIHAVLQTTPEEKELIKELGRIDNIMQTARNSLRAGNILLRKDII